MENDQLTEALLALEEKENALLAERNSLRADGIRAVQNIVDRLGLKATEIRWSASAQTITPEQKTRKTVPPKYQGPNGELWSGRGRKPIWVQAIIDNGENLDEYLIK